MEDLILLCAGVAIICGFILLAQAFVWAWERWDKRRVRQMKTYREPRRKRVEDYWNNKVA